ncbi:MAG: UDP-N-acetylmuramoyl-tripeptide--D-alanyl-D-alanine ligase [Bacteriovoracaceae bacterium]|nr:UDP-N-acetylmuramoyl-tripeptide--D-alanyl-D-alanine ligase [Bacteriovoracaceae bacterium]
MINTNDILLCKSYLNGINTNSVELTISTDSRKFDKENTFISLYGDNFDSIKFIPDVIKRGCEYIILERREQNLKEISNLKSNFENTSFIEVNNVFQFILELANIRSNRFQENGGIVIGLTGSNGKTTNKEILKYLLSFLGEELVYATKGNLNNQIGVPLTIFELKNTHKVAIVEMGTNFPGEIKVLSECANPLYGFITNIGHAHIEFLKSLDGVFIEKTALYETIAKRAGGLFVINGFDPLLKSLKGKSNTLFLDPNNISILENGLSITLLNKTYKIENLNLLGDHQKINMAMCLFMAASIFPNNVDQLVETAKNYTPPAMNRGEIIIDGDKRIYLDAYNANPSSMKASITSYISFLKRENVTVSTAFFILGDMNELGESAPTLHEETAKFLLEQGVKNALFVGRYAKHYQKGFGENGLTFPTVENLKEYFADKKETFKEVFIKGSRSLQLESILDIRD